MLGRPSLWSANVLSAFLIGAAAGYSIAIPVGPIAVLIVRTGLRRGFRIAAAAGAGTATVDLIYATLAVALGGAANRALAAVLPRRRSPPRPPRGGVRVGGGAPPAGPHRYGTGHAGRGAFGPAHVRSLHRTHAA